MESWGIRSLAIEPPRAKVLRSDDEIRAACPQALGPHHYGHATRARAVPLPQRRLLQQAANLVGFVVRGPRPGRRLREWRLVSCRARWIVASLVGQRFRRAACRCRLGRCSARRAPLAGV
jgi:hypothetical protein